MTAEEVAQALRLGLSTVYGLARSGDLPSLLIGSAVRFDPLDVETYKAQCRRTTTKPASGGATNLTGLLTDADSALESFFRGTGRQPKRKPMRASKTPACSHLSLAHTKANP
jgi:excisionase family DNA binding protein